MLKMLLRKLEQTDNEIAALGRDIYEQHAQLHQAAADAEYWYKRLTTDLEQDKAHKITETEARLQARLKELENYRTAFIAQIEQLNADFEFIVRPWLPSMWVPYLVSDNPDVSTPDMLRIGQVKAFPLAPALVPFIQHGHVVIYSTNETRGQALQLLQSLVTRIIVSFPPQLSRLTLIDPLDLGDNFPFLELPKFMHGGSISVESDEITSNMRDLVEHARDVLKGLKQDFVNIEAYNQRAKLSDLIPYRFVAIADFPTRFERDNLDRFKSVWEKGVRSGVYMLVHVNRDNVPADIRTMLQQDSSWVDITPTGASFGFTGFNSAFTPDTIPGSELFNNLIDKVNEHAKRSQWLESHMPQADTQQETEVEPYIFISYSRHDQEFMNRLRNDLEARGFKTWTDEHLEAGTPNWQDAIEKALRESAAMLILLSPDAKESFWVKQELNYGEQFGITPFPVLVRGDQQSSVPIDLILTQWVDMRQEDLYQGNLEKLSKSLRLHIDTPHVFFCYTKEDTVKARQLRDELRRERVKIWFRDEADLSVGQQKARERAILQSGVVLALLSDNANISKTVKTELAFAGAAQKQISYLLIGGEHGYFPMVAAGADIIDLRDMSKHKIVDLSTKLNAYLRTLVDRKDGI